MREGGNLAETLESKLAQWSGRTGIRVEIWALPASDAPAPIARAVLTVLDEALANVEHHSGASTVSIAVTVGRGGLRMTVSDHGRGFNLERTGPGIDRMRAAFDAVGGTLSINSVPGEGSTVTGVVARPG
ncbi:sensor histidine kinase [Nonomuraea sp. NPDC047897]|uniref:sensor histidine kinase n=1 Tax=Nonomuraea sp. NPDC047897 TaxID=3364346 RepID=UPI003722AD64